MEVDPQSTPGCSKDQEYMSRQDEWPRGDGTTKWTTSVARPPPPDDRIENSHRKRNNKRIRILENRQIVPPHDSRHPASADTWTVVDRGRKPGPSLSRTFVNRTHRVQSQASYASDSGSKKR